MDPVAKGSEAQASVTAGVLGFSHCPNPHALTTRPHIRPCVASGLNTLYYILIRLAILIPLIMTIKVSPMWC